MRELDLSAMQFVNAHAEEVRLQKEREVRRMKRLARQRKIRNRRIAALSLAIALLTGASLCVFAQENTKSKTKTIAVEEFVEVKEVNEQTTTQSSYIIVEVPEEVISEMEKVEETSYTYHAIEISDDDIELFERIVMAECYDFFTEDEMLIIASVIRNRVESSSYPNTVRGVITEKNQFETYSNGRYLEVTPNDKCKRAVERALKGDTNINQKIEYFCTAEYYQKEATFAKNKQFFHSLENHDYWNFRNVMLFKVP